MTLHLDELRVLICEDEYLLASDLADELGSRGVSVAGIMARVSDIHAALGAPGLEANAAILDVKLLDGDSFSVVAPMLERGMAVVLCTGYGVRDLPREYAHLPKVGKPTNIEEILEAFAAFGASVELQGRRGVP